VKVALLHPYLKTKGGAEKLVLEYASRSRHDIDIYTLTYFPDRTFPEFENLSVHELPAPSFLRRVAESFFVRGVAYTAISAFSRIDVSPYDAVLVDISGLGEAFALRNYIPGRTFAYCHSPLRAAGTEEDLAWMNRHLSLSRRLIHAPARKVYNAVQRVIWPRFSGVAFNSNLSRSRALRLGLIPRDRTSVIYPGVDLPGEPSRHDDQYFLYVSRFAQMKRQYELIRAWARAGLWREGYRLVLAGYPSKSSYFAKVQALASKTPSVEIYTDVSASDLSDFYSRATLGIFLGYYEDFGIAPLEVMSYGKYLLSPDSGGFLELVSGAPALRTFRDTYDDSLFVSRLTAALIHAYEDAQRPDFHDRSYANAEYVRAHVNSWDEFARQLDDYIER